jgi:hypothetical protein
LPDVEAERGVGVDGVEVQVVKAGGRERVGVHGSLLPAPIFEQASPAIKPPGFG